MELSKQVCSLELANKLKELEVKQESLFYWTAYERKDNPGVHPNPLEIMTEKEIEEYDGGSFENYQYVKQFSAFTVAELGEMLPTPFRSYQISPNLWCCTDNSDEDILVKRNTEANARAEMLIYLLENKLINL